ncbi:MAG: GNAT family N-acetyltransferase [Chloroflexota bacterium]
MDIPTILELYDQQERQQGTHSLYRREVTPQVVRHICTLPNRLHFVIYSQLTAVNADHIIQQQIDYFQTIGGAGLEWKVYDHDQPPDIGERLIAHGFAPDETEGLLVLDIEEAPDSYWQPVTADVRRVTTIEQIRDIVAIQQQVWDKDFHWLETQLSEFLKEPDSWSIYIGYVDEKPVCAAWASFPPGSQFAGLWGGATLADYRKQGVYTAVVNTRAQEARQRGYRFLMIDASDMSRAILEKRGFRFLTNTTPYTWRAASN